MLLNFTLNGRKQNILPQGGKYNLSYPCTSQTTCYPYESDFPRGKYRFDVYGAGGGSYVSGYESPGGFSTGVLSLKQKTRLYFYVGGKGICTSTPDTKTAAVFGGGGSGHNGVTGKSCSGGGASDVRVLSDTLNHRVIVAGGAGGTGYYPSSSNVYMIGGKGGGNSGTKGEDYDSQNTNRFGGNPGTQTSGGTSVHQSGIFGYGGNRTSSNGGGGGGGWYGGAPGGATSGSGNAAGGGGSGFVFTELNSNVSLDSNFLLLSGRTEIDTGNNIGDGRIYIEVLEMKIHRTYFYRNIFLLELLFFSILPYVI
jgi:hypothetical protein